jgi:autotransporter passenger strand-loop-strand repeat protein
MEPQDRKRQIMIWYTIAAVIGVLVVQYFWSSYSQIATIPYSQFEQLLNDGKIAEVTISADAVQGSLKEALPDGKREFFAVRVDPQLVDKLLAHGVVVKGAPSGGPGATEIVSSGGTTSGILLGGHETVLGGGRASGTIVSSGGYELVNSRDG